MRLIRYSAFFAMLAALTMFIACKKTIGGIDRDTPPLPSGNQQIAIKVFTTDGSNLPSYNVSIIDPDGGQSSQTADTEEFIIDPIQTGPYTITITTDAGTHIGQTKEVTANVPTNNSDDYVVGTEIYLTTKNSAVLIDNAAGGTVNVPAMGTGAGGLGSQMTTVTIPPGALPGTGSTAISITPTPSDGTSSANGLRGVQFHFEPDGTTFNTPITIEMPLDLPQTLVDNGVPTVFEYEDGSETQPITLSADGSTGTTQIDHFSTWTIGFEIFLDIQGATRSQTFQSICSEGLEEPFTFSGTYGSLFSSIFQIPVGNLTVTINGIVEKEPILYYILSGRVTAFTTDYEFRTRSGIILEQSNNIPLCADCYTVSYTSTECHDSGG